MHRLLQEPYVERVKAAIKEQCDARNIVEVDGVMAELAAKYGKPVDEMHEGELKRVQRELDPFFRAYLGDRKRRIPGEPAADRALLDMSAEDAIDEVEATDDVLQLIAYRSGEFVNPKTAGGRKTVLAAIEDQIEAVVEAARAAGDPDAEPE